MSRITFRDVYETFASRQRSTPCIRSRFACVLCVLDGLRRLRYRFDLGETDARKTEYCPDDGTGSRDCGYRGHAAKERFGLLAAHPRPCYQLEG